MTKFDTTDLKRIFVSAIGALLVSATCIVGTVAPVRADGGTTTPAAIRY